MHRKARSRDLGPARSFASLLLGLAWLFAGGPSCSCDQQTALTGQAPILAVEPRQLDFGPVTEATEARKELTVSNPGRVTLHVTAGIVDGSSPEFGIEGTTLEVAAGSSGTLTVVFVPEGPGSDEGTLLLTSDDPDQPTLEVPLLGGPIAPELLVEPEPVDFTPSTEALEHRTATLRNGGQAALHVTQVGVDPTGNPDFSVAPAELPATLLPDGTLALEIAYARSLRAEEGRLLVLSDDPVRAERAVRLLTDPLGLCGDGLDNDDDGLADFPDDPGCDGVDDDDETNPPECIDGATQPCGDDTGACAAGTRACARGAWGPCEGEIAPVPESCNGLDDDCDGTSDDGLSESCLAGACDGIRICVEESGIQGGAWSACQPLASGVESCNDLDDDCDGQVDEGVIAPCVINGCAGEQLCIPGSGGQLTACQPTAPGPERCNGVDDDCDGELDEDPIPTACGTGACEQSVTGCVAGVPDPCTPLPPEPESCNGIDDDCNGLVDDGTGEVSCGTGACAVLAPACVGGLPSVLCTPGAPAPESCNGLDDDCNGTADDGLGTLSCGTGACARTVPACLAGAQNVCTPGPAGAELCNGLDDDCNGSTDEGAVLLGCGTGVCATSVSSCTGGVPGVCIPLPPGVESCNGLDDDCDGSADDGVLTTWFRDGDFDGVGTPFVSVQACAAPPGHVAAGTDCDDARSDVHPGAVELCDGVDDDCSGATADGSGEPWLGAPCDGPDADLCAEGTSGCTGGMRSCSDASGDSVESCNGVDDDCDGSVDEGLTTTYYRDQDGDGYGALTQPLQACTLPVGYVGNAADCDDTRATVHPGASELCDGLDTDCSGATADGTGEAWYGAACDGNDADLCNEGLSGCVGGLRSCSDATGSSTELCNGADDDCNGQVDEGANGCGGVCVLPNAPGTACDAIGPADLDACADDRFVCSGINATSCSDLDTDVDGDGYSPGLAACGGDCNDAVASRYPGASELCNGADDDCDGSTDEGVTTAWYRDLDGDGHGNGGVSTQACSAPPGYVAGSGDCDDGRVAVHPGALEICDGLDTDCSGATPDGSGEGWYGAACDGADTDACQEGTFTCVGAAQSCSDVTGSTIEACNGADDDCDGAVDEGANGCGGICALANAPGAPCDFVGPADLDACTDDAYVCSGMNATVCANAGSDGDGDFYSAGAVICSGDCADGVAARHPGVAEVCGNAADDDCDGFTDEGCAACDPDGVYTKSGAAISYSCAFGFVSINVSQFTFINDGAMITTAPDQRDGPLMGAATTCPAGNFTNVDVYPGTCQETFTLTGSFTGANTWTGTYTWAFSGGGCFDCTTQSWPVTATRP